MRVAARLFFAFGRLSAEGGRRENRRRETRDTGGRAVPRIGSMRKQLTTYWLAMGPSAAAEAPRFWCRESCPRPTAGLHEKCTERGKITVAPRKQ